MSTKSAIVKILEENRNMAISGQELAGKLNVTRAAVWKAIKSLQDDGYLIVAAPNRGYLLEQNNDVLSEQGVKIFLPDGYEDIHITVCKSVDSTNSLAKKLVMEGAPNHSIVIANEQTSGRGRRGKSFFSPAGTGIYMSVVLRPQGTLADASMITIYAAVAVSQAIEKLTGKTSGIKWVNDIFVEGKKVCGILTEAISDIESGMVEALVVGIGVNLSTERGQFPEGIQDIASSLFADNVTRNEFAAQIAGRLFDLCAEMSDKEIIEEYRNRLIVLNRHISYERDGQRYEGKAVDINENGNLIVQTEFGTEVLKSGEISIGSGNV